MQYCTFDPYWYTNLSLTLNLTVNILLRALKSFIEIHNSVYTFISKYLVSNTHAIFHVQFISQSVVSNQFKTNQSKTSGKKELTPVEEVEEYLRMEAAKERALRNKK